MTDNGRSTKVHPRVLQPCLEHAAITRDHFTTLLEAHASRFVGAGGCLRRFAEVVESLETNGSLGALAALEERHNELCMAEELLLLTCPVVSRLEFEPSLAGTDTRIDFRVTHDSRVSYVEVKTIHPDLKDSWDRYQRIVDRGLITENVRLCYAQAWMGGELAHQRFSAREKMWEYAVQFEDRIDAAGVAAGTSCVLALFGNGFDWSPDELEGFVAYYTSGRHRADDPLAKMEAHAIRKLGEPLTHRISAFGCFMRGQFDVSVVDRD